MENNNTPNRPLSSFIGVARRKLSDLRTFTVLASLFCGMSSAPLMAADKNDTDSLPSTVVSVKDSAAPATNVLQPPAPRSDELREVREELAQQRELLQTLLSREMGSHGGGGVEKVSTDAASASVMSSSSSTPAVATTQVTTLPAPALAPPPDSVSVNQQSPVPSVATASVAPEQPASAALSDDERRAYASGVSLAYEMQQSLAVQKSLGISLPQDVLTAGLEDALSNHPLRMSDHDIQSTLASLNADFTSRMQSRRADEVARGRDFRTDFRRKKGVVSDAGSLYLIETRGSGRLRTSDMATLLVTGRLPDGTVFDGSGAAGQVRKVKVGAMLPAIAIGLQKVGAGGHLTVVVPPEKGYGDMGLPPTVPGGATLIFDITVKGVNEAG